MAEWVKNSPFGLLHPHTVCKKWKSFLEIFTRCCLYWWTNIEYIGGFNISIFGDMGFEDSSLRWDVWVAEFSRHGAAILSHKHSKKLKYADTGQWKSRWMASRNIGEYHTVVRIPLTFCLDSWVVTDTINIDFTTSTYCRSATYSRITLERLKNAGAIDMVRVSPLSSLAFRAAPFLCRHLNPTFGLFFII